jgi:3-oxoacyl-[acyl-carrier protein] reductase
MDLNLKGKTVLITGGSRGIGLAAGRRFAEEGCALHLVARDAAKLGAAAKVLEDTYKANVKTYSLDMSLPTSAPELARLCPDVDILVNNAGALPTGDIFALDEAAWLGGFQSKVFNYINLTRQIIPAMRARRSGVIVNVIGLIGEKPTFDAICRGAANAALIAFTRALGSGSTEFNVRVVGVNPPTTRTERSEATARQRAQKELGSEERWPELFRGRPFGRLAETAELADMIAFLSSDRAAYMSGTVVNMDGGSLYR